METNSYMLQKLSLLGDRYDGKLCFESRDEHFNCLDSFSKDRYDNHYKCKSTYELWKKHCPDGLRNVQMEDRNMVRDNNTLYTQEQLDDYTKRKSKKTLFPTNIF